MKLSDSAMRTLTRDERLYFAALLICRLVGDDGHAMCNGLTWDFSPEEMDHGNRAVEELKALLDAPTEMSH